MSASTERKNRAAAKAAGTDKKTNAALEAEQKARKTKRKWIIGTIAVVLCIALILLLSSPLMYRITTAETVGSRNYSPAEVQYVKASAKSSLLGYGYDNIVSYFGQESADQLLASTVESNLIRNTVLLDYAKEQGISLSAKEKEAIDESLKTQIGYMKDGAKANGVSYRTYTSYVLGAGVNESVMRSGMQDGILANKAYMSKFCELSFSPEELAAYYEDPVDGDLFSYTSFLVKTEEGADPAEAKTAAEALVMGFTDLNDGEADPQELFNDLLAEDFPDQSATPHEKVTGADLDETLRPWLSDEARQAGDITAIEADDGSGWNVILFQERSDNSDTVAAVRHILIMAEADENGNYTDEAKAAAKAKAEEILAAFQAGSQTEAEFASLATVYSADSGSSSNGGLYSSVTPGQTVEEFDRFCFEPHQYGDTAIVYGESDAYAGYHVMFYVGTASARDAAARDALRETAMSDWLSSLTEGVEPVQRWAYKLVG